MTTAACTAALLFCKLALTGAARADSVHALPSAVAAVLLLQAGIYTRPQVLRVLTLRRQLQELQALLAEQEVRGQNPGLSSVDLLDVASGMLRWAVGSRTSASPCCPNQSFSSLLGCPGTPGRPQDASSKGSANNVVHNEPKSGSWSASEGGLPG